MNQVGKWFLVYYFFSTASAIVGYAIETNGSMAGDWWLPLIVLPLTTILAISSLGSCLNGLAVLILEVGSLMLIGSTIGYVIRRTNVWLYGVSVGCAMVGLHSVRIFFCNMSV